MSPRTREILASGIIGGGVVLAITIPTALGMPAWVPFVTAVVAMVVLAPFYDRTRKK